MPLRLNAVAFISSQNNNPILIRTFSKQGQTGTVRKIPCPTLNFGPDELKYHYIAHTSLDVIDERGAIDELSVTLLFTLTFTANANAKSTECYLGLLYAMEDVAVYGYITPLKTKIVLAIALSDSVVLDAEIITVCFLYCMFLCSVQQIGGIDLQSLTHGLLLLSIEPIFEARCPQCHQ